MAFCQRHNHYSYVDDCPSCTLLGDSDSSSNSLFGSREEKSLYSLSRPKSLFGETSSSIDEMSASLNSSLKKTASLYERPEPPKPLFQPPEFPRPVKNPLGDMLGYRQQDVIGRDTFRPFMDGGASYNVGPSFFGNSYVRDYRGNLVGQMRQGPLGSDTLFPPPDFGPSFR